MSNYPPGVSGGEAIFDAPPDIHPEVEAAALEAFVRRNRHLKGITWPDALDMLLDSDSHLGITEGIEDHGLVGEAVTWHYALDTFRKRATL